MIIPRHKICDICDKEVGVNRPYITLPKECIWAASGGSSRERKKLHICYDCWDRITREIGIELDNKYRSK